MAIIDDSVDSDDPRVLTLMEISKRLPGSSKTVYLNSTHLRSMILNQDINTITLDWIPNSQLRIICNGMSTRLDIDNPSFIDNAINFIQSHSMN